MPAAGAVGCVFVSGRGGRVGVPRIRRLQPLPNTSLSACTRRPAATRTRRPSPFWGCWPCLSPCTAPRRRPWQRSGRGWRWAWPRFASRATRQGGASPQPRRLAWLGILSTHVPLPCPSVRALHPTPISPNPHKNIPGRRAAKGADHRAGRGHTPRRRWAVRVGHQHLQASHRGMGGSAGWWLVGGRSEGWWWCAGAGPASHLPSAQKTQEPRPTSPAPAPTCTSPLGTFASTRLSPPSGPPWPTPTPAWTVPTTNWPASAQTSRASAAASPTWRPACCGRHRTRTRPRPRRPRRRPRPPWPCA